MSGGRQPPGICVGSRRSGINNSSRLATEPSCNRKGRYQTPRSDGTLLPFSSFERNAGIGSNRHIHDVASIRMLGRRLKTDGGCQHPVRVIRRRVASGTSLLGKNLIPCIHDRLIRGIPFFGSSDSRY